MAAAKTNRSLKLKWLTYILLAIVVLIAGFKVYEHFSTVANKQAFQNARVAIDNIYYQTSKQLGPADDAQISSSCSKRYQEFSGYKDLTCHLDTNFVYGVDSQGQANNYMNKVQGVISENKGLRPARNLANSIKDSVAVGTVYHSASDIYTAYGLKCTVNYIYDTPKEIDLSIKNPNRKPFEVTIGCYGPAKQQYYRLAS